jgi:hypothetical protein
MASAMAERGDPRASLDRSVAALSREMENVRKEDLDVIAASLKLGKFRSKKAVIDAIGGAILGHYELLLGGAG